MYDKFFVVDEFDDARDDLDYCPCQSTTALTNPLYATRHEYSCYSLLGDKTVKFGEEGAKNFNDAIQRIASNSATFAGENCEVGDMVDPQGVNDAAVFMEPYMAHKQDGANKLNKGDKNYHEGLKVTGAFDKESNSRTAHHGIHYPHHVALRNAATASDENCNKEQQHPRLVDGCYVLYEKGTTGATGQCVDDYLGTAIFGVETRCIRVYDVDRTQCFDTGRMENGEEVQWCTSNEEPPRANDFCDTKFSKKMCINQPEKRTECKWKSGQRKNAGCCENPELYPATSTKGQCELPPRDLCHKIECFDDRFNTTTLETCMRTCQKKGSAAFSFGSDSRTCQGNTEREYGSDLCPMGWRQIFPLVNRKTAAQQERRKYRTGKACVTDLTRHDRAVPGSTFSIKSVGTAWQYSPPLVTLAGGKPYPDWTQYSKFGAANVRYDEYHTYNPNHVVSFGECAAACEARGDDKCKIINWAPRGVCYGLMSVPLKKYTSTQQTPWALKGGEMGKHNRPAKCNTDDDCKKLNIGFTAAHGGPNVAQKRYDGYLGSIPENIRPAYLSNREACLGDSEPTADACMWLLQNNFRTYAYLRGAARENGDVGDVSFLKWPVDFLPQEYDLPAGYSESLGTPDPTGFSNFLGVFDSMFGLGVYWGLCNPYVGFKAGDALKNAEYITENPEEVCSLKYGGIRTPSDVSPLMESESKTACCFFYGGG